MPSQTTNYGLVKPNEDEFYDVKVQNGNMDIIDRQMKSNADGLEKIGELTDLQTTNKSTLVSAINEVFQAGNSVKSDVVTALLSIDPSLPITTESTWADIEAAILEVQTGVDTSDATATAAQILSDATAYVKGNKVTGTMPNRGAVTSTINAGNSYTIPEGYHNGSGKVTANSLASQTTADATAANILSGKTAWVNGQKIAGTMPNRSAENFHQPNLGTAYDGSLKRLFFKPPNGYYDGQSWVYGDSPDFTTANIVAGKNIFGVDGSATIESLGGKRFASGVVTGVENQRIVVYDDNDVDNYAYPVVFTGLNFLPLYIIIGMGKYQTIYKETGSFYMASTYDYNQRYLFSENTNHGFYVNNTGFKLAVPTAGQMSWVAFG